MFVYEIYLNCKIPNSLVSERRSGWLEARSSRMMVPRVITAGTILYLRLMNQGLEHRCSSCVALHFITAKVKTSSIARPRFQTCFKDGQVVLDLILDPIKYWLWLWTSKDRICKNFRSRIREHNCAFAFASIGYGEDRRLEEQGIRGGIKSFLVRGAVYHRIGTVTGYNTT